MRTRASMSAGRYVNSIGKKRFFNALSRVEVPVYSIPILQVDIKHTSG